jgi:hypothetical protein
VVQNSVESHTLVHVDGVRLFLNCGHQWACCLSPGSIYMSMESYSGMILTGEDRKTRRKLCPSAALSTTNPTWTDLGMNPGIHCDRLATNCLSHGAASFIHLLFCMTETCCCETVACLSCPLL